MKTMNLHCLHCFMVAEPPRGNTAPFGVPDIWSHQKGVTRRGVTLICPNLFRFPVSFQFVPIGAPCFRGWFRFAPISSDLLFFPGSCSDVFRFSEQIRRDQGKPFRATPLASDLAASPRFLWFFLLLAPENKEKKIKASTSSTSLLCSFPCFLPPPPPKKKKN